MDPIISIGNENVSPDKIKKIKQATLFDFKSKFNVSASEEFKATKKPLPLGSSNLINSENADATGPTKRKYTKKEKVTVAASTGEEITIEATISTENEDIVEVSSKQPPDAAEIEKEEEKVNDTTLNESRLSEKLNESGFITQSAKKKGDAAAALNKSSTGNRSLLDFFSKSTTKHSSEASAQNSEANNDDVVEISKPQQPTEKKQKPVSMPLVVVKKLSPHSIGKFLFENSASAQDVAGDKHQLRNEMFGDLAMIAELYNTFSYIYEKKQRNWFKHVLKRDQIEFTKIKLNDLISVLDGNLATQIDKVYFMKLIENLLRILLKYETNYEIITLFGTNLTKVELDEMHLQEICRIIVEIVISLDSAADDVDDHQQQLIQDERGLFRLPSSSSKDDDDDQTINGGGENKNKQLLEALKLNKENEPFASLNLPLKIELLKLLCEQILWCEHFNKQKEELENKLDQFKTTRTELKSRIKAEQINTAASGEQKSAKIQEKNQSADAQKLNELEALIKSHSNALNKFRRIEALGADQDNFVYWKFSSFDGIILEKLPDIDASSSEKRAQSEWYSFETKKELGDLIKLLKMDAKNAKLVAELNKRYEQLFSMNSSTGGAESKQTKLGDDLNINANREDPSEPSEAKKQQHAKINDQFNENFGKYLSLNGIETELQEEQQQQQVTSVSIGQQQFIFVENIDKLVEKIFAQLDKAMITSKEANAKYQADKQMKIAKYFEENSGSFEAKFQYIKSLLIDEFELLNTNDTLKDDFESSQIVDFWKVCVKSSQSLSCLYLLNCLLCKHTNWRLISQNRKLASFDTNLKARKSWDEVGERKCTAYSLRTRGSTKNYNESENDQTAEESNESAEVKSTTSSQSSAVSATASGRSSSVASSSTHYESESQSESSASDESSDDQSRRRRNPAKATAAATRKTKAATKVQPPVERRTSSRLKKTSDGAQEEAAASRATRAATRSSARSTKIIDDNNEDEDKENKKI